MTEMSMQDAKSAYKYPLLVKQLWHTPLAQAPDQVIVYRDMKRFTYRQLRERIGRLASSLARLGVGAGDTVGVLDWDSNRFLEAYFAVPMMVGNHVRTERGIRRQLADPIAFWLLEAEQKALRPLDGGFQVRMHENLACHGCRIWTNRAGLR